VSGCRLDSVRVRRFAVVLRRCCWASYHDSSRPLCRAVALLGSDMFAAAGDVDEAKADAKTGTPRASGAGAGAGGGGGGGDDALSYFLPEQWMLVLGGNTAATGFDGGLYAVNVRSGAWKVRSCARCDVCSRHVFVVCSSRHRCCSCVCAADTEHHW
jgi:hypothetical protein